MDLVKRFAMETNNQACVRQNISNGKKLVSKVKGAEEWVQKN